MLSIFKKTTRLFSFKLALMLLIGAALFMGGLLAGNQLMPNLKEKNEAADGFAVLKEIQELGETVTPQAGLQTKIVLGDSILKLIENGVIDMAKIEEVYASRGGLTAEQRKIFEEPSTEPLTITHENAQFLVNLLWGIGISNKNIVLTESPAGEPDNLFNLASTGGWVLGKKDNGGYYYNQFEIIKLTAEQEELVKKVAANIYRPCCGNSTAFPDCNHGAAILAVLQLGAAQGLNEDELYEESLKFNSYWFTDEYVKMATLFKIQNSQSWDALDPKTLLGSDLSSGSGFRTNVAYPLSRIGLFPQQGGGGGCSV